MRLRLLAATILWVGSGLLPASAESFFGGGNKLDPSFCNVHAIRQTVVYVDDSILVSGNTA